MEYIELDPSIKRTVEIVRFKIIESIIHVFSSVNISILCVLRCENKEWEERRNMVLTGEEYVAWGNDDNYIIDLVKNRLSELL